MKYAIIGIPTVQNVWTRAEYAHLHILEHLMCLGRNEQIKEEYNDYFANYWCQFMGTQRKNALFLETQVVVGYEENFANKLTEAWQSEPNWAFFQTEKELIIEELVDQTFMFKSTNQLESKNLKHPYNNNIVSGMLSDIRKANMEDIQKVWEIVRGMSFSLITSDEPVINLKPALSRATFHKEYVYTYDPGNNNIIMQFYISNYISVAELWLLDNYLYKNWSDQASTEFQILPGLSIIKVSFELNSNASSLSVVKKIYTFLTSLFLDITNENAIQFEERYYQSSETSRLRGLWDKAVYNNFI